jgi:hypothetical protein
MSPEIAVAAKPIEDTLHQLSAGWASFYSNVQADRLRGRLGKIFVFVVISQ